MVCYGDLPITSESATVSRFLILLKPLEMMKSTIFINKLAIYLQSEKSQIINMKYLEKFREYLELRVFKRDTVGDEG